MKKGKIKHNKTNAMRRCREINKEIKERAKIKQSQKNNTVTNIHDLFKYETNI